MKLTGVAAIESGILNRGEGLGNSATAKKTAFIDGMKVYCSPPAYKASIWTNLIEKGKFNKPLIPYSKLSKIDDKVVVQRTGTIVESEEVDLGGTMLANTSQGFSYKREGSFTVDNLISINSYLGDMDFITNGRIASIHGVKNQIVNREMFYGLYVCNFVLEIDRVGIQLIHENYFQKNDETAQEEPQGESQDKKKKNKKPKVSQVNKELFTSSSNNVEKLVELYRLCLPEETDDTREAIARKYIDRVERIYYSEKLKSVVIILTKEERIRRIKELLITMGELGRRMEGSYRNLVPSWVAMSLDYQFPKYYIEAKNVLSKQVREGYLDFDELTNDILQFVENDKFDEKDQKTIYIATPKNYTDTVKRIMERIEEHIDSYEFDEDALWRF